MANRRTWDTAADAYDVQDSICQNNISHYMTTYYIFQKPKEVHMDFMENRTGGKVKVIQTSRYSDTSEE